MTIDVRAEMAKARSVADIGAIPNPEAFSAHCAQIRFNPHGLIVWRDMNVASAPQDLAASDIPDQFHPAILKAVADYSRQKPDHHHVSVGAFISAGDVSPGRNITRPGKHIDHPLYSFPYSGNAVTAQYIVSSCFPTRFYQQSFALPEAITRDYGHSVNDYPGKQDLTGDDLQKALIRIFDAQARDETSFTPDPYHLVRYDSLTVHEAQCITSNAERTLLQMRIEPVFER